MERISLHATEDTKNVPLKGYKNRFPGVEAGTANAITKRKKCSKRVCVMT